MTRSRLSIDFHPLTSERWNDFELLFGDRGACGGCWCMWWRLPRSQFNSQKGAGNKSAMQELVGSGPTPGILAYAGDDPVGWCAIAPRDGTPGLDRSRVLKRVDDQPVWSVTCLFVRRDQRRRGLCVKLLKAAIDHVRQCGGSIVEGYPVEPAAGSMPDAFVWTGLASSFLQAGFRECARRSPTRPVMRFEIVPRNRNQ